MNDVVKPPIRILIADDEEPVLDAYRAVFSDNRPSASASALHDLKAKLFSGSGSEKPLSEKPGSDVDLFNAHYCRDAEQAVQAVRRAVADGTPFAVAFLDMRMPPGEDGVWAATHIRECDPEVDIVIATAFSDTDPRQITAQVPPEEKLFYVQKPFHPHEVRQMALALGRSKWSVENRFRQLAHYDSLTGLPNRTLFLDRMNQTITSARRHNRKAGVLFIDLDNFKRINDSLGHSFGDEILKITADRLRHCARACDAVMGPLREVSAARLGGDEFTILLSEIDAAQNCTIVAQRILQAFVEPMRLHNDEVIMTPSIGIATFPDDGEDVQTLLKNADLAMYFAKHSGPNSFEYHQDSMNATTLQRITLEKNLRQAIARDEFTLHYQPQTDMITGVLKGAEALLRWDNEELGSVPPAEFVPVAEQCGLILAIGEWVLRTACLQAKAWRDRGVKLPRIGVNVSAKQFYQQNFPLVVERVLEDTQLEPHVLEIEITESLLMENTDRAIATMHGLRALGVQIALDDFGTGYSSLSRLKEFPIDCLKIDHSFVRDISTDANDQAIASAVLAMAGSLNMRVVAEGVETSAQFDFLKLKQCNEMQGYLICRPLPAEKLEEFLLQLPASD
jgi:diguanylate cyclase (GGDEF)-like protein